MQTNKHVIQANTFLGDLLNSIIEMAPVVEAAAAVPKEEVIQDQKTKEPKDEKVVVEIAQSEENNAPAKVVVVQNEEKKEDEAEEEEEEEEEEENVATETEPKTGVSFPTRLRGGKQLNAVGVRRKSILGLGVKIYAFGIYSNNEKLKELLRSKNIAANGTPKKPTKEMFQVAIDSDTEMVVKMAIVFAGLTMTMVKKNFDEGLGASIKKLTGGRKDEELTKKVMGAVSENIKLTTGSVIEITRLPGFTLQTKVNDELVSKVESEMLCRAFFHLYLGDDPFDKDAKERFGESMLALF